MSGPFSFEGLMSQRCSRGVDQAVRVAALAAMVALATAGCRRPPSPPDGPYLATATPLRVGLADDKGLCIAIDRRDPHGLWWWEPGASGCARRSTGPGVFHADQATVARSTESDAFTAGFRLQLHSATPPSFLEVRLVVEDGRMRTLDYRSDVAVHRRQDLIIREEFPPPR
jgi:hypothetical protein